MMNSCVKMRKGKPGNEAGAENWRADYSKYYLRKIRPDYPID